MGLTDVLDDHPAVRLHTGGMGGDVLHVLKGGVNHMPLVGVHRLQGGTAASLQHLLSLLPGVAAEAVLPLLPVALGIYVHPDMTVHIPVHGVVGQMPVSYTHLDVYKRQPLGHDVTAVIHVVTVAIRAALIFGNVQPGNLAELLKYTKERVPAFVNTFGAIDSVVVSAGAGAIALGFPVAVSYTHLFYTFDAPIENAPKIGVEISDLAASWDAPALKEFYAGCTTMADYAKKAETMPGADFLCLHFESADPNGANRSVADCVADAKAVADAVSMPIVVMGCKNIEKDGELFSKIAEALQGKNILVLSARNEDYKTVGASVALAYGQKVGAETADDINLAKQLNIMLKGLSINPENIVMNVGTAAVGYGFEYVASTLDRIRLAALAQSDADLQMPIMSPVSPDAWSVKESTASEEDEPEWGSREERAIDMEVSTAAANLTGGADAVIMRHPAAVATIKKFITELV